MSFYEDLVMQTQMNYSQYYHVYASGGTPYHVYEPWPGRGVPGAVGLENHCPGPFPAEDVADDLWGYAGMYLQYGHPCVKVQMQSRFSVPAGRLTDEGVIVFYLDASLGKWREVLRAECPEVVGIDFCRPVAPHEHVVKADAHFRHSCVSVSIFFGRYFHCRDEVLLPVRPGHTYGKLAAGEDDRFRKPFYHKAQCGG